jgi:peptide/nickel transport system permease protein
MASALPQLPQPALAAKGRWRGFLRRTLTRPSAVFAVGLIALFLVAAAFAPLLAPYDPNAQNLGARLAPPGSVGHLLGTDRLGRDVLSRILYGARLSLLISSAGVALGLAIGLPLGLLAGYAGRWLDEVIMRLGDIQLSIPFILLVIAFIAALGTSLTNTVLILGLTSWVTYARIVRGEVLRVRELDYVQAAGALGAGAPRRVFRHILPNILGPLLVIVTLEFARLIIAEAALSFLGLSGVPAQVPSWGQMLSEGREVLFFGGWWVATFPGVAITLVVLAVNLFGDVLAEVLDPRQRS